MSTQKVIQTVVADDEPKARNNIKRLLQNHPEFEVVQYCKDGKEALEAINSHTPDLVFLDIQMPVYNGFELLQKINPDQLPSIVFVTAYDEFALQAFEYHALDYLMKPFDSSRFEEALKKVKGTIETKIQAELNKSLKKLLETIRQYEKGPDKVMIKQDGKIFFLDASDIKWIESAGNYIKVVAEKDHYMIRETMKNIEEKLDKKIFFRIHRSTIVNISSVKVIEPWFHGDYQVTMKSGDQFTMSRNYKNLLEAF